MSDDQRSRGGDIAVARYIPPVSVPDMERMAHAIVQSGLFGVRTVPQALTLMWLAQAEGRHPVLAARDYHIIEGKPSKTAEAMMRDFLAARGTVEWHQLDDSVADATFSHPYGGEVRIKWDMERAGQAGLLGRRGDMWKRYPRQMLRSRCVSEGIRTVGPMATSGLYVPEEVGDYEPRRPRMKDVTPPPEPEPYDPETGEVRDVPPDGYEENYKEALRAEARDMAAQGTERLRRWLIDRPRDRAILRDAIGTREQPGELTLLAQQADADALRERLQTPPATTSTPAQHAVSEAPEPPQTAFEMPGGIPPAAPSRPTRRAAAAPAGHPTDASGPSPLGPMPAESGAAATSTTQAPEAGRSDTGEPPPRSTIWQEDSYAVPLRDRHGGPDWESWVTAMVHLAGEATEAECDKLMADNKDTLQRLKVSDSTRYRSLMHEKTFWHCAKCREAR